MDRPRQIAPSRWRRWTLLRTGVYALFGTATACILAVPLISVLMGQLATTSTALTTRGDTGSVLLQGSTFVFAYLWLSFYMLERYGSQGTPLTTTNGC